MLADPGLISQIPKVRVGTKSCNLLKFQRLNSIVGFGLEMRVNYFRLSGFFILFASFLAMLEGKPRYIIDSVT